MECVEYFILGRGIWNLGVAPKADTGVIATRGQKCAVGVPGETVDAASVPTEGSFRGEFACCELTPPQDVLKVKNERERKKGAG